MHFAKMLVSFKDGRKEKESQNTRLDHLYRIKKKGYKRADEELKKRIKAIVATFKRYKNIIRQHWQKKMFQSNRSKFYQKLD